jgi:hypothetical protein
MQRFAVTSWRCSRRLHGWLWLVWIQLVHNWDKARTSLELALAPARNWLLVLYGVKGRIVTRNRMYHDTLDNSWYKPMVLGHRNKLIGRHPYAATTQGFSKGAFLLLAMAEVCAPLSSFSSSNGLHMASDTISWSQFGMLFVNIMQDWRWFHISLSSQSGTKSWYISTQCSVLRSTTSLFFLCHTLLSWILNKQAPSHHWTPHLFKPLPPRTDISCIQYMDNTHDKHAETSWHSHPQNQYGIHFPLKIQNIHIGRDFQFFGCLLRKHTFVILWNYNSREGCIESSYCLQFNITYNYFVFIICFILGKLFHRMDGLVSFQYIYFC